jgi:hypothetical protein
MTGNSCVFQANDTVSYVNAEGDVPLYFATYNVAKMGLSSAGGLSVGLVYYYCDAGANNIIASGNIGAGLYTPLEDIHAADTVRADVAFNVNGTDGVTQAASAGTICIPTAIAGGIVTAQSQITYAADGIYLLPTSITISKGLITAIV